MKLILVILVLLTSTIVFAQDEKPFQREKILSIVPQYVFQNGFRVDYEFTLQNNRKSWLQFSPELFISTDGNNMTNANYKSMRGIGLEIHHKYFMREPSERYGYYFAYGGGLQFFGIKNDQSVQYTYSEYDTNYISYRTEEVNTTINRVLLNFVVGKQITWHKPFIVDYYLGVGFRYSMDKNLELMEMYNQSWFDNGYSGSLLVAGLKLGFNFEK
ncbi:MAG: hypothetical protein K0M40_15420 [Prolixibacteraceae bacterium]|nr:hypothetical protein [Prolixibacteraceae bacterium]